MIDAYLARIGYEGPREPTAETLRALQRAHLFAVPFENLDIIAGRPPILDEGRLLDKIITRGRGGFCYELNGAFAWLLRALGFGVTMLSARPLASAGGWAPEFAHLTLVVGLEERWLADVGFGDSFLEPLRLDEPGKQVSGGRGFRVGREGRIWTMTHLFAGEDRRPDAYRFTLVPRRLEDFQGMCTFYATDRTSGFRKGRVVTRATPSGRVSLSDRRLIVAEDGERRETPIEDDATFAAALREHFGLSV